MRLFRIQDDDRPAYVLASTLEDALRGWLLQIRKENDGENDKPALGVEMVADDNQLLIVRDGAGCIIYNGLNQTRSNSNANGA